jgi:hypothetical protein
VGRSIALKRVRRLPRAIALLAALGSGCATEIRTLDSPAAPALERAAPLPRIAGIAAAESRERVPRLAGSEAVARFASSLAAAEVFEGLEFPATALANPKPDLVLDVAVESRYDPHRLRNLASDWLVGLSLLTLQPLIPSIADLCVEIRWEARASDARTLAGDSAIACNRIQSTWLRVPEADLATWHDATLARAIDAAVAQIARARARLAPASSSAP